MKLAKNIELPSKYLDCYEAALVTILKYMGLPNESYLIGTQTFFYFIDGPNGAKILARFNQIQDEWEYIFNIFIKHVPIANEVSFRNEILSRLDDHMPVCLPTDLFFLPYTPHYLRLHQTHFINIFGYEDDRYFVVCPYYRYEGWLDADCIKKSFFSLVSSFSQNILFIPTLELQKLTTDKVQNLIHESCQNMLGLRTPIKLEGVDPKYLGLMGIGTFSLYLKQIFIAHTAMPLNNDFLDLSRHLISVGNSRYWFYKLIEQYQQDLFSIEVAINLQKKFDDLVLLWRGIGHMLGISVHTNKLEKVESVILYLENAYEQEKRLFSYMLSLLPDYEEGLL